MTATKRRRYVSVDHADYLAFVAATIDRHGWLGRRAWRAGRARGEEGVATADLAWRMMTEQAAFPEEARYWPELAHYDEGRAALAWAREVAPRQAASSDDYWGKIQRVVAYPRLGERQYATAATIVAVYRRDRARAEGGQP